MSWAAARRPPSSEYLLFDDQPPSRIEYAFIELTAKTSRMPMLRFAIQYVKPLLSPIGMTGQARKAATTMMAGARAYRTGSTPRGAEPSFVANFTASAASCHKPD